MQDQSSPRHLKRTVFVFKKINICHVCTELRWWRLEITGAFVCKAGGCGSLTEVMRLKPTTIMQEAILKR